LHKNKKSKFWLKAKDFSQNFLNLNHQIKKNEK